MRSVATFIIIPPYFCLYSPSENGNQNTFTPMKKIVKTASAPAPVGPYNQAIIHNHMLFASGQVALDPVTREMVQDSIENETRRVMENIGAILKEAGLAFDDVIKCTIFVTDIKNYGAINGVYAEFFNEAIAPARELVQVVALPKGGNVEISAIAAFR